MLGMAAASLVTAAEMPVRRNFGIIGFVKPFQRLPFDQMADTAGAVGWPVSNVPSARAAPSNQNAPKMNWPNSLKPFAGANSICRSSAPMSRTRLIR
jgi:hypothetical protein